MKQLYQFYYQGINSLGQKRRGLIQTPSITLAKTTLQQQGLYIQKLNKHRTFFLKKISQEDLNVFSRQLATLIESGIPLVKALEIIAKGQANFNLNLVTETLIQDLESGLTLTQSLAKHPSCFNELLCHLIHAGEQSGSLELMLKNIASYKEKMQAIKKKVINALTYPLAILLITIVVTLGMLVFIVPQFEALFKGFGAELPALTKAIVAFSQSLQSFYLLGIGIIIFAYCAFVKKRQPKHQLLLDKLLLLLPIVGNLLKKAAIARFARTLSITFAAGLPLVEALVAVSGVTGNALFAKATHKIKEEISTGLALTRAMQNTKLFPNMVVQMVSVGEESGTLDLMLEKVADFYEEEIENAVDSLGNLVEPIIMCILGVLVGGLILAMYLPLFKLGSVI